MHRDAAEAGPPAEQALAPATEPEPAPVQSQVQAGWTAEAGHAAASPDQKDAQPDLQGMGREDGNGDSGTFRKIARFMTRIGLRPARDAAAQPPSPAQPPTSPLPDEVAEQGWTVAGPVETRVGGIDRWPVRKAPDSVTGYFHRYRSGALTGTQTYRRLAAMTPGPATASVQRYGTVDLGNARCDFDLVASILSAETDLDRWLADSPPSEQRALHLLKPLAALLLSLEAQGVRPIVLEPAHLEWLADGSLRLCIAGALAEATAADHYRADFARSPLLSRDWSAPELVQSHMLSANAAVFSVGQLMAHALWGQCCSHGDLSTGAVAFQSIADPRLARVLMGCLWPSPQGRWRYEDLAQAAVCADGESMPATGSWAALSPGAASTAFVLAGGSYWRLDDLLATAVRPECWSEAVHNIKGILAWAGDSAWSGQAGLLREAMAQGRSADWALVALVRAIRPESPMTWRAADLSDSEASRSLIALAQRALRGDADDEAKVRDLFRADLRGAFSHAAAPSILSAVHS